MMKTVRLLEGLAEMHKPECSADGACDYCAAMCDMAAAITADWVASLDARHIDLGDEPGDNPAPLRVVLGGHPLVQLAKAVSA